MSNTDEEECAAAALPPLDLGEDSAQQHRAPLSGTAPSSSRQQQTSTRSTRATSNPPTRGAGGATGGMNKTTKVDPFLLAGEEKYSSEEDDHEKEDMDLDNEEEEEDEDHETLPDHAASDSKVTAAGRKRKTDASREDEDDAFIQGRRRRKRLCPDERQEIADIMDHLITEGNSWRHHNWRLLQWKRGSGQQPLAVPPTPVARATTGTTATATNSDESNELDNDDVDDDDNGGKPPARKIRKSSKIRTASVGPNGDDAATLEGVLMHAGDARIYTHCNKNSRDRQPRVWPWAPRRNVTMLEASDRQWDVEYGDGIHPVAFSSMRLSAAVSAAEPPFSEQPPPQASESSDDNNDAVSSTFPPLNFDLDPAKTDGQQVSERDAPRVMLLRCWERAVHAASTIVVDSAGANSNCSATGIGAAAASPLAAQHQPRTRDAATEACQRLEIDPFHEEEQQQLREDQDQIFTCCSCGIQRSTKESLEDHFYGNVTTNGCCWTLIERIQRDTIAKVLENEASNQTQQLMRTIMTDALQMEDAPDLFGCFDVLKLVTAKFEKSIPLRKNRAFATAQQTGKNAESSGAVTETLEVSLDEPPLHINQCVIDAFRSRIVDRYAEVPR